MTKELETGGPAFPSHGTMGEVTQEGMTTRTYAAIHLRVPQSEHDWLNEMIRESRRFELAKAAMQGYVSAGSNGMPPPSQITRLAIETADAMLAAAHSPTEKES